MGLPMISSMIPALTRPSFLSAVRDRFKGELDADTTLFIYIHGREAPDGRIEISGSENILAAQELKQALDELQGVGEFVHQTGCMGCTVVVIIEACYAGSFLDALSGPERVIVASAGNEPYLTENSTRNTFSSIFLNHFGIGSSILGAFYRSLQFFSTIGYPLPELSNGYLASSIFLDILLTGVFPPTATDLSLTCSQDHTNPFEITARIDRQTLPIERVWVQVRNPDINFRNCEIGQEFPGIELYPTKTRGIYQRALNGFEKDGEYALILWGARYSWIDLTADCDQF